MLTVHRMLCLVSCIAFLYLFKMYTTHVVSELNTVYWTAAEAAHIRMYFRPDTMVSVDMKVNDV